MLTAIVKRRVAALVVGVMSLLLGLVMVAATTVTCGEDTMQPGDTCMETGADDSPVQRSYEEEKRAGERNGRFLVGVGAVALVVAGVGYAGRLRGRRGGR